MSSMSISTNSEVHGEVLVVIHACPVSSCATFMPGFYLIRN